MRIDGTRLMGGASAAFAEDFKTDPYWWERTPRPKLETVAFPKAVDVAVVGSGYTGLCAALQTARGGRETIVFDAQAAGWGCSTRNGGQVSTSVKGEYDDLVRRHGEAAARAVLKDGRNALDWLGTFIADEAVDCDFRTVGRFHAAHTPGRYRVLERNYAKLPRDLGIEAHLVPRSDQHAELGSDAYHGGVVYPDHASLDPARYHHGLLDRALASGVSVVDNCAVTAIEGTGSGFRLATARGELTARDVVLATNGYSGAVVPWLRRRVIPIGSYIIATEPLAPGLMDRLIPKDRVISDTRRLVYYYRASPDRRRMLFGGRVSFAETDPRRSAPRLRAEMVRLFPDLVGARISHSWVGFVAYTFDTLAHIGQHSGTHYAAGYCGSGVSMASYLGMRLGRNVLGLDDRPTGLERLAFQTRPLYTGNPWFLAPTVMFYRWCDRLGV